MLRTAALPVSKGGHGGGKQQPAGDDEEGRGSAAPEAAVRERRAPPEDAEVSSARAKWTSSVGEGSAPARDGRRGGDNQGVSAKGRQARDSSPPPPAVDDVVGASPQGRSTMVVVGHGVASMVKCHVVEPIMVAPGAIVAMSDNADIGTQSDFLRSAVHGGQFWLTRVSSRDSSPSMLLLAPLVYGGALAVDVSPGSGLVATSSSFLAHTRGVVLSTQTDWSLSKALFGAGAFLQSYTGRGKVCITGPGDVDRLVVTPGTPIVVDNENILAYSSTLDYEVVNASSKTSWVSSAWHSTVSREGMMLKFRCKPGEASGSVYFSTRPPLTDVVRREVIRAEGRRNRAR
jgi:uncharacterized protein (AIM24 family)